MTDKEKTEREKMLNNELYLATDNELSTMQYKAKQLLYTLNLCPPSKLDEQKKIIIRLFKKIGTNFTVVSPFYCDYLDFRKKVIDNP